MRTRSLLAVLFTAALFTSVLGFGVLAAPAPAVARDFQECNGVWVVIDYGSIGQPTRTACATDFGTGTAALKSAGVAVTISDGFVYKLDAEPAKPDINKAYWSYWHATVKADGTYSDWAYSQLGSGEYHPTKGNAEGWHYVSLSDAAAGPGTKPPDNPVVTPSPSPTKTSSTPHPSATATATKSASPTPTRTSASPTASSASPSPTATTSETPTPSQAPVPSATPSASPLDTTTPQQDTGSSPIGLIVAAVIVLAGGRRAGCLVVPEGTTPLRDTASARVVGLGHRHRPWPSTAPPTRCS